VRAVKADGAIEDIDLKFLAGFESEFAADVFGDYDLKLWRNLDGDHGVASYEYGINGTFCSQDMVSILFCGDKLE
jgi:hypothetical protein